MCRAALAAAENKLILVDGNSLIISDNGLGLQGTNRASIHMDTSPSSPGSQVSAFQTNSSFIKIVRWIHWSLAHSDGVAFIQLPVTLGSPA